MNILAELSPAEQTASDILAIICAVVLVIGVMALVVLAIIGEIEKEENKKDFKRKATDEELLIISKYEAHKRQKK